MKCSGMIGEERTSKEHFRKDNKFSKALLLSLDGAEVFQEMRVREVALCPKLRVSGANQMTCNLMSGPSLKFCCY